MTIKIIDQLGDLTGKRVFIRTDFNVPLDDRGQITDDLRIRSALPTIRYALEQQAKVIVASHMGRPKGKVVPKYSLRPAAARLGDLLGKEVKLAPDCVGPEVEQMVAEMQSGEVIMLENLRFHAEEEKNEAEFSKKLGQLADVYVDDAFACAHRAHASISGITAHVTEKAAGFLMKSELEAFRKAMENPARPLAAIIGGAKVSSKLGVLENMMNKVDKIVIGGAMAFTFLKAQGRAVGKSKVEDDMLEQARSILTKAEEKRVAFLLPEDVVVAVKPEAGVAVQTVAIDAIPAEMMGLDVGPATVAKYKEALADVKTVVWNGPMGMFEIKEFAEGTFELARFLGESSALVIIGGGDTDTAVHQAGQAEKMDYISTGGGAFLEMMEGREMPGFTALEQ